MLIWATVAVTVAIGGGMGEGDLAGGGMEGALAEAALGGGGIGAGKGEL